MSPVAEAAVEVEFEVEFEAGVAVASEAFAPSLQEAAWERTRLFQVWGGCQRGEAWEAGL